MIIKYLKQTITDSHHRRGFTLVELIASIALVGLLTAVFGMGLVSTMQTYTFNRANVIMTQKGQLAMARITRELQELTGIIQINNPGQDPYVIYTRIQESAGVPAQTRFGLHFNPSETNRPLRLYTDIQNNTITVLDNSTITLGNVLVDEVKSFTLNYFQGIYTWPKGGDIRLLSAIRVTLELIRSDDATKSQTFSALIHLRNTDNYGGSTI